MMQQWHAGVFCADKLVGEIPGELIWPICVPESLAWKFFGPGMRNV